MRGKRAKELRNMVEGNPLAKDWATHPPQGLFVKDTRTKAGKRLIQILSHESRSRYRQLKKHYQLQNGILKP